MRGLTVIVAEPARLRVALEIAAAQAALGGRARVFCQGKAVAALRFVDDDPAYRQSGLPTLAQLFDDATALSVETIACQSGLALCKIEATEFDRDISVGGLVSLLRTLGEDRLLVT